MLKYVDVREDNVVKHERTGNEYKIISHRLQVKVQEGCWKPAVSYCEVNDSHYDYNSQIYICDTETFMQNFSASAKTE